MPFKGYQLTLEASQTTANPGPYLVPLYLDAAVLRAGFNLVVLGDQGGDCRGDRDGGDQADAAD